MTVVRYSRWARSMFPPGSSSVLRPDRCMGLRPDRFMGVALIHGRREIEGIVNEEEARTARRTPSEPVDEELDANRHSRRSSHPPEVSFSERPAGRDTLGAIAEERNFPRAPERTRIYGDRISNAPGALSPKAARALDEHPDIVVSVQPAGRETFAIIERELRDEPPDIEIDEGAEEPRHVNMSALSVDQMRTFIVRAPLAALESPSQRRRLVEQRLLPHLPVRSSAEVTSVDVRPWQEAGTLLVRVWCQIP